MADLTVIAVDGEGEHTVTVTVGQPLPAGVPAVVEQQLTSSGQYVDGVVTLLHVDDESTPVPVEQPADVATADTTAQE